MSDCCYLSVWVLPADVDAARAALNVEHEFSEPEIVRGFVHLVDPESNYGAHHERIAFADSGVSFYGHHGAGGSYGPFAFVGFGGAMVEVPADFDGAPVARVGPSGVDARDLKRAAEYIEKLAAVNALGGGFCGGLPE